MNTEIVDVDVIWTNGGSVDHYIDTFASINGEIKYTSLYTVLNELLVSLKTLYFVKL